MSTLNPYTGPWNFEKASFLLGRTTFGKTKSQVDECIDGGLEATMDKLFKPLPDPGVPIHHKFPNDPGAPVGSTWIDKYYPANDIQGLHPSRRASCAIWQVGLMQQAGVSIQEKLVLFWHEHMPINDINRGEALYKYIQTIRQHAVGNFRSLIEDITIDPSMLVFLNGYQNSKESPNENYGRELLELFTIGRGEAAGEGDYTNYTEQDVVEIARALTGWIFRLKEDNTFESLYIDPRHDTGSKQLSHRFDNVVIENAGREEYKKVIEVILSKEEVARHICRQLHIWFVGSNITDDVEQNIIVPMGKILFDDNYEIENALRTLLSSEYFLDGSHNGCMISSPYDYLFKIINTMEIPFPEDLVAKYFYWEAIGGAASQMEMAIMSIPSVAGWKAYYQAPNYYQFWISSVTLGQRDDISTVLINGVDAGPLKLEIDALNFASKIDNATEPNDLINGLAANLFVLPISENQKTYLKEILIPGLPDFEWTVEYGEYLADPDDPNKKNAIESKLKGLINAMIKMPEFHLM